MSVRRVFTRRRIIAAVILVTATVLLFENPFFEFHRIEGPSMWPLFDPAGEIVIVRKAKAPAVRGELVIVRPDDDSPKTYLKRVVALGGETVRIANGDLLLGEGAAAEPSVRPLRAIVDQSVPLVRLADLVRSRDPAAPGLVDDKGFRWLVCRRGALSLADLGGAFKIGDGRQATELSMPEESLTDDHYSAEKRGIVRGTEPAVDLVLSFTLEDLAPGTVLSIRHMVDGNVFDAFSFERIEANVQVRANGHDACVVASGRKGFGRFRLVMIDRMIAVLSAAKGDPTGEIVCLSEARPVHGAVTTSRLEWHLDSGFAVISELELNRDIVYTSNRGESHFATREPLNVVRGNVFLLGDNSAESDDGRKWGDLWEGRIVGRPVFVIWPIGRMRRLP